MKNYYFVLLFFITLSMSFGQTPINPVSATTTYTESIGTSLVNAYNGAGLPAFPTLTGTHDPIAPDNCFVANTVLGSIDFNLGGNYDVDGLSFWNLNTINGAGINGVQFYASLDGINYTPIPGAPNTFAVAPDFTSDAEIFTFSPVNANFIRMEVISSYGNSNIGFSEIAFSEGNTLSLPQQNISSVKLFPNPANTYLQVNGLKTSETYNIYNVLGSEVLKGTISNKERIDISQLEKGVYIVQINNIKPIRIIKK